jgi:hypothetical protein
MKDMVFVDGILVVNCRWVDGVLSEVEPLEEFQRSIT